MNSKIKVYKNATTQTKQIVKIAIAIITRTDGYIKKYLVARRPENKHQGGLYEFIGGKVEEGESPEQTLKREVLEEVGLNIKNPRFLCKIAHEYEDKIVQLLVFYVSDVSGGAQGREGQWVDWVDADTLVCLPMPKANIAIKRMAVLKPIYVITKAVDDFISSTAWLDFYIENLAQGVQVYVRSKQTPIKQYAKLVEFLQQKRSDLSILSEFRCFHALAANLVSGFHITQVELMALEALPRAATDCKTLFIASIHDIASIQKASLLGADAVTLSPIYATSSHPNTQPLTLQDQLKLLALSSLPVYALGGVSPEDCGQLQSMGYFGVAGISQFIKYST